MGASSDISISKDLKDKELKEKTDQFESLLIKMMLDNAMKDEDNIFTKENDPGSKIYKSMYRDELAKSSAGGFGFSQMLYEHLIEKQKS